MQLSFSYSLFPSPDEGSPLWVRCQPARRTLSGGQRGQGRAEKLKGESQELWWLQHTNICICFLKSCSGAPEISPVSDLKQNSNPFKLYSQINQILLA